MFDSIRAVKTLHVKLNGVERLGKTYSIANAEIKIETSPRKLYFINREKKIEILFLENENNNKALIKSSFYPNINLDPTGNMMRKNQHYTINELGFDFIGQSIASAIAKDKDGFKNFEYKGKVKKFNFICHLIQYENKNYSYVEYTVGKRETVSSIANKLIVNDYLVRYKNDLLNDFGYLHPGKKILVPNLYCKKAVLFIDEKTLMPVSVSTFDDFGLFESYEYPLIIVNPTFLPQVFHKNNPEYRF